MIFNFYWVKLSEYHILTIELDQTKRKDEDMVFLIGIFFFFATIPVVIIVYTVPIIALARKGWDLSQIKSFRARDLATVQPNISLKILKPRPLVYIISVLPYFVILPVMTMLIFPESYRDWLTNISYFLRPGKIGYLEVSTFDAILHGFIFLTPILSGLIYCRLWGWRVGVLVNAVMGIIIFGYLIALGGAAMG